MVRQAIYSGYPLYDAASQANVCYCSYIVNKLRTTSNPLHTILNIRS